MHALQSGARDPGRPKGDAGQRVRDREGEAVICAACGHEVTAPRHSIDVAGSHRHVRTNPEGATFEFRCFAEAVGCVVFGPVTDEATWFPGCSWRVALCGGCGVHLGWRWEGAMHFFGLIADRLAGG